MLTDALAEAYTGAQRLNATQAPPVLFAGALTRNFFHQLAGSERGGVSVEKEIGERDGPRAVRADGVDFSIEREQHGAPIAAGIGFGDGAADGAAIADLHVGDSRGAIVQNGNFGGFGGVLDIRVARHGADVQCSVVTRDVAEVRE